MDDRNGRMVGRQSASSAFQLEPDSQLAAPYLPWNINFLERVSAGAPAATVGWIPVRPLLDRAEFGNEPSRRPSSAARLHLDR